MSVEVNQERVSRHGGIYDVYRVVEVLDGKYLRPPDVALIATEFCRIKYLTGWLAGQTYETPVLRVSRDELWCETDGTPTRLQLQETKKRLEADLALVARGLTDPRQRHTAHPEGVRRVTANVARLGEELATVMEALA